MIYNVYTYLIATPLFLINSIVNGSLLALVGLMGDRKYFSYWIPRFWAWFTCFMYLIPVTVKGKEYIDKNQTYLFLPNHQGYFDIFLVYAYLGHNFKWMLKDYLRNIPFVGYACAKSGHVYVGESHESITKAILQSKENLEKGISMAIFPEGTRTHDGKMGEFKRGAFLLASQLERPIVPITINGSFEVFNREATMISHYPLELIIHKPISVEEQKRLGRKQIIKDVYDIIYEDLLPQYK